MAACHRQVGGWCPLCYANIRGRAAYKGHRAYRPSIQVPVREVLVHTYRLGDKPAQASPEARTVDGSFEAAHPALWEYLSLLAWEDGKPRTPATLLVCVEDGRFKGCLNDRANSRSVWLSADSLTGLLARLEAGLQQDDLEWRKNQPWQGRKR